MNFKLVYKILLRLLKNQSSILALLRDLSYRVPNIELANKEIHESYLIMDMIEKEDIDKE